MIKSNILLLLLIGIKSICITNAFAPLATAKNVIFSPVICSSYLQRGAVKHTLLSNTNKNDDTNEVNQYLDKASRLRKEAEELEAVMRSSNVDQKTSESGQSTMMDTKKSNIVAYKTLDDSTWMISYRFASDPVQRDDSGSNMSNSKDQDVKLTFYSGKVYIRLKGDGYTELMDPPNTESATSSRTSSTSLSFTKFWGWDEEISREDGNKYLSFSADVVLPPCDPNYKSSNTNDRFYFNSQVEIDDKTGEISLVDGTVTLKRDVEPPGGFWGVFNAGGILAQFRYCGEFLIKPIDL